MFEWEGVEDEEVWGESYNFLERLENKPECIPSRAVRNGKYEVVEGKGLRRRYYHYEGVWAKEKELYKHYPPADLSDWNLLPNLPEKEWEVMYKIPRERLNRYWRNLVDASYNRRELKRMLRSQNIWMSKYR
jgi:hypothetical protein